MRLKPSFIIIGGVKCASSSLYRYLNYHPQVLPCKEKEPRFFNNKNPLYLIRNRKEYFNKFPDVSKGKIEAEWIELNAEQHLYKSVIEKDILKDVNYITGEATANIWSNAFPRVVKAFLPKVKIIMIMRDPSLRYISHYRMFMRFYKEGKKKYYLGELADVVNSEIEKFKQQKKTRILDQGMYIKYLPNWKKAFGDNLFLLSSNDLNSESSNEKMNEICNFLNIDNCDFSEILAEKFNSTGKVIEDSDVLMQLQEFHAPYLEQLYNEFGIKLN